MKIKKFLCIFFSIASLMAMTGCSTHTHEMQYVQKTDPTCLDSGTKEHYFCTGCGKYYSDEKGDNEISADSIVISALGHDSVYVQPVEATVDADGNIGHYSCTRCHEKYTYEDVKLKTGGFFDETAPYGNWQGQDTYIVFDDESESMVLKMMKNDEEHHALAYKRIGTKVCNVGEYRISFDMKRGRAYNGGIWFQYGNTRNVFDMFAMGNDIIHSELPYEKWVHFEREFTIETEKSTLDSIEIIIWGNAENYMSSNCYVMVDNIVLTDSEGNNVDEYGKGDFEDFRTPKALTDEDIVTHYSECTHEFLTYYPEVVATTCQGGLPAYYECIDCGKTFLDSDATEEVDILALRTEGVAHNKLNTVYVEETDTHLAHYKCEHCNKLFSFDDIVVPEGGFFNETAPYANWQNQKQTITYDEETNSMVLEMRKTTSNHAALTYKRVGTRITKAGTYTFDFDIKLGSAHNGGLWIQYGNTPVPFDIFAANETALKNEVKVNAWTHISKTFTIAEEVIANDGNNIELIIWSNATDFQNDECYILLDNIDIKDETGLNIDERGCGNFENYTERTIDQLLK